MIPPTNRSKAAWNSPGERRRNSSAIAVKRADLVAKYTTSPQRVDHDTQACDMCSKDDQKKLAVSKAMQRTRTGKIPTHNPEGPSPRTGAHMLRIACRGPQSGSRNTQHIHTLSHTSIHLCLRHRPEDLCSRSLPVSLHQTRRPQHTEFAPVYLSNSPAYES